MIRIQWSRLGGWCWRCLGRAKDCSAQDFRQAAGEVTIVCVSAFLPFWAGVVFFSLSTIKGAAGIYGKSFMTSGEMLLISCAIIGPLIYILTKRYGNLADPFTVRFPYSTVFSITIAIMWFVAGGVFVIKKASIIYVNFPSIFDDNAMRNLSVVISIAAVGILYLATVFRNYVDRLDPGSMMHAEQEDFVKEFTRG